MIFNPVSVDDYNLGLFLEEACETGEAFKVHDALLYETYRDWCLEQGEFPLRRKIFECRFGWEDDGPDNRLVWKGIRLRENARGYSTLDTVGRPQAGKRACLRPIPIYRAV